MTRLSARRQVSQRPVTNTNLFNAPGDELVLGAAIGLTTQPKHGSLIFLGYVLPQANTFTMVL